MHHVQSEDGIHGRRVVVCRSKNEVSIAQGQFFTSWQFFICDLTTVYGNHVGSFQSKVCFIGKILKEEEPLSGFFLCVCFKILAILPKFIARPVFYVLKVICKMHNNLILTKIVSYAASTPV